MFSRWTCSSYVYFLLLFFFIFCKNYCKKYKKSGCDNFLTVMAVFCCLHRVFKILVDTPEDRMLVLQRGGLNMLHEAFNTVHMMHHEATACHVASDIVDILRLVLHLLRTLKQTLSDKKGQTNWIFHLLTIKFFLFVLCYK